METKGELMVSGDFSPQARLAQHLKDVRLILTESERANCQTPLSQLHQALLETAVELGFGDSDNSAIIEVFRRSMERQE
jgi:3-hydroxyisobutyrate dehydrogenase